MLQEVPGRLNMQYPVFLSSLCGLELGLRKQLFRDAGQEKLIYVDEIINYRPPDHDHLDTVDELLQRILEAESFVCVFWGPGPGSPITLGTTESQVSFFEIELVWSALLGKRVHLFLHENFEPDKRLRQLINLLRFHLPDWVNERPLNDAQIIQQMKRIVGRERLIGGFRRFHHLYSPARRLAQGLFSARRHTPISFLDEQYVISTQKPRNDFLEDVMTSVASQRSEQRRLTQLWMGIKELMAAPYSATSDPELLSYWNSLLGEWSKAGAWYGLHADMPLGCLAALNSVADIRKRIRKTGFSSPEATAYPGVGLASAKYSIAKKLIVRKDREERLKEALEDVNQTMSEPGVEVSDVLAVRGSIYRQLDAIESAVADYKKVMELRDRQGDPGTYGQAMAELGFAYLRQGKLREGLAHCREGVDLMRGRVRAGFLARGLRKLTVSYLCNGRLLAAWDARNEAKRIADDSDSKDQR